MVFTLIGVIAEYTPDDKVTLRWNYGSSATSFGILMVSSTTSQMPQGGVAGTAREAEIPMSRTTNAYEARFVVSASISGSGTSYFSQVATVTIPALAAPPAAPTGLTITHVTSTEPDYHKKVTLTWADHSTDEAGVVIEQSSNGVNWSPISTANPRRIRSRSNHLLESGPSTNRLFRQKKFLEELREESYHQRSTADRPH